MNQEREANEECFNFKPSILKDFTMNQERAENEECFNFKPSILKDFTTSMTKYFSFTHLGLKCAPGKF
jgi:hypothetical protein